MNDYHNYRPAPFIVVALVSFALLFFTAFQSKAPKQDIKGVEKVNSQTVTYSPTDLGMNNITLPASADTAFSTVINTSGVRAMQLMAQCSQAFDARVQYYLEDGTTVANAGGNALRTGMTAGSNLSIFIGTEVDTNSTNGAAGVAFRFPQRAVSFAFRNTTATPGTCTARAFLFYD